MPLPVSLVWGERERAAWIAPGDDGGQRELRRAKRVDLRVARVSGGARCHEPRFSPGAPPLRFPDERQ
jgi:hypothetical protein